MQQRRGVMENKTKIMLRYVLRIDTSLVQAVSLMSPPPPQIRLREGDQEEEVSFRASGPSPASADNRFVAPHHRPTDQHHAPEKVRVRTASLSFFGSYLNKSAGTPAGRIVITHEQLTLGIKGLQFSYARESISVLIIS